MVPISCSSRPPLRLTQAHTPMMRTSAEPMAIISTPDMPHGDRFTLSRANHHPAFRREHAVRPGRTTLSVIAGPTPTGMSPAWIAPAGSAETPGVVAGIQVAAVPSDSLLKPTEALPPNGTH